MKISEFDESCPLPINLLASNRIEINGFIPHPILSPSHKAIRMII